SLATSVALTPHPPLHPLVPYTTLFRSLEHVGDVGAVPGQAWHRHREPRGGQAVGHRAHRHRGAGEPVEDEGAVGAAARRDPGFADRKSTRLNSSHVKISYAIFCLKKKN